MNTLIVRDTIETIVSNEKNNYCILVATRDRAICKSGGTPCLQGSNSPYGSCMRFECMTLCALKEKNY